jgi:hypothetical protein
MHKHAVATTSHRDRLLGKPVHLDWSGYRHRDGDDILLAAQNDTDKPLHIDTVTTRIEIPPGSWAITGQDNRFRVCTDMVFRLTYEPTEESE